MAIAGCLNLDFSTGRIYAQNVSVDEAMAENGNPSPLMHGHQSAPLAD
jgi:hypothetical protein